MKLTELASSLRNLRGVQHKLDIRVVRERVGLAFDSQIPVGDDCAAIPDGEGGFLLLAIEGLLDEFVAAEPWFAGYCAVMVNLSDVYAMGGRPIAIVDALWTADQQRADLIWDGMTTAARKYGVPIIGGHTNARAAADHLAAAVLGRAKRLLSSFDARSGDVLMAAIDLRGEWFGAYPYWNASTTADATRLRGDLEVLPILSERVLGAAKDISMAGLVGTATMFAECSGVGAEIDVSKIPRPSGVEMLKWLSSFPSFGFLLAVPPSHVQEVRGMFIDRDIAAEPIGEFNDSRRVTLRDGDGGEAAIFWNLEEEHFMGFSPGASGRAAQP